MSKDIYFGIDFGTTNSSMAWYDPDEGRVDTIRNADKEDETPSLVYFGEDDEILVGEDVVNLLEEVEDSEDQAERDEINLRVVKSIKRKLLSPPVIPIPGRKNPVRPVEVVAEILKKLKRDAEKGHFHEEIGRVVLTYPATFSKQERDVLLEAAKIAKFREVELLDEPTAAAIAFSRLAWKVRKGILVYDLGAGTFDLSMVARDEDGGFHVSMEPQGDPRCGGNDFDLALYRYCDEIAQKELGRPISLSEDIDLVFLEQCCERKENLSSRKKSRFSSFLPSENGTVRFRHEVHKEDFENLIRDRIEETVRRTTAMLERAKERGHEVDAVVLIGGSSRIPLVKERLEEALPVEPVDFSEKDYAVALGSAYHANDLWRPQPKPRLTEVVVSSGSSEHFKTIGQALKEVQPGGKIRVRPGVYQESLVLDKPVEIIGDGPTQDIVLESTNTPCLKASTETGTVKGLTMRRLGEPDEQENDVNKSAVAITAGSLVVDGCDITAEGGWGVLVQGSESNPTIRRCKIHDGNNGVFAKEGGGGVVEDCELFRNQVGVGIKGAGSNPTIRRCKIREGSNSIHAEEGGEGVIEDCDLFGSSGPIVAISESANPTIRRCKLHDGGDVGIIAIRDGRGIVEDCEVFGNASMGVAITEGANPTIRRCKIHDGKSAGLYASDRGEGVIEDCDIYGNVLAGVYIQNGANPTIRGCEIHDGEDTGVYIEDARGVLEDSDVFGNTGIGILIKNDAKPTIQRCNIHDQRHSGSEMESHGIVATESSQGVIEACELFGDQFGVTIGANANPTIRRCKIHDSTLSGIGVGEGKGIIESCDLFDNKLGIFVTVDANPTIRRCKIHDNEEAIRVAEGSQGVIEGCDLFGNKLGVGIRGTGANPTIRRCEIHHGEVSVYVADGGQGVIEDCEIYESALPAIQIRAGASPNVRGCKIHDQECGVIICDDGGGIIEDCDFFKHADPAVSIKTGANPTIRRCQIHDGESNGVLTHENGRGVVENCTIFGNAGSGVQVREGSNLYLRRCTITRNKNAGILLKDRSTATVENCDLTGNGGGKSDIAWRANLYQV